MATGRDKVLGEEGNDELDGGPGNDQLWPGGGSNQVTGDQGDDTIYLEAGLNKVYAEEGDNIIYAVYGDGDQDDLWCGWQRDQNYGRLVYTAPAGTTPDSSGLVFGDNVKCCSVWLKDPETGTETMLIDSRSRIICRPGG